MLSSSCSPSHAAPICRYNKEALRLRIFYLLNQPAGAASHTVLLQVGRRADGLV